MERNEMKISSRREKTGFCQFCPACEQGNSKPKRTRLRLISSRDEKNEGSPMYCTQTQAHVCNRTRTHVGTIFVFSLVLFTEKPYVHEDDGKRGNEWRRRGKKIVNHCQNVLKMQSIITQKISEYSIIRYCHGLDSIVCSCACVPSTNCSPCELRHCCRCCGRYKIWFRLLDAQRRPGLRSTHTYTHAHSYCLLTQRIDFF